MGTFSINGAIIPKEKATVSVLDRGLLYGDGVFEGIRMYNRHVFKLDEHLERLYESSSLIDLKITIPKEQFRQEILDTAKASTHEHSYIRITISRLGTLGLHTTDDLTQTRMIIVTPLSYQSTEAYETGLHLCNVSRIRIPNTALPMRAKTLNYLNNILAVNEAKRLGADDALLLNNDGYIAESSGANIFFIKNNTIFTPSTDMGILIGITRNCILQIAKENNYTIQECSFTQKDLLEAEEIFLTGTAMEIMPVYKINDQLIGNGKPGEQTKKFMKWYKQHVVHSPGYKV